MLIMLMMLMMLILFACVKNFVKKKNNKVELKFTFPALKTGMEGEAYQLEIILFKLFS